MALINGHNSSTNMRKRTCNYHKLDLVNMNAFTKMVKIYQFVLKILNGNETLA